MKNLFRTLLAVGIVSMVFVSGSTVLMAQDLGSPDTGSITLMVIPSSSPDSTATPPVEIPPTEIPSIENPPTPPATVPPSVSTDPSATTPPADSPVTPSSSTQDTNTVPAMGNVSVAENLNITPLGIENGLLSAPLVVENPESGVRKITVKDLPLGDYVVGTGVPLKASSCSGGQDLSQPVNLKKGEEKVTCVGWAEETTVKPVKKEVPTVSSEPTTIEKTDSVTTKKTDSTTTVSTDTDPKTEETVLTPAPVLPLSITQTIFKTEPKPTFLQKIWGVFSSPFGDIMKLGLRDFPQMLLAAPQKAPPQSRRDLCMGPPRFGSCITRTNACPNGELIGHSWGFPDCLKANNKKCCKPEPTPKPNTNCEPEGHCQTSCTSDEGIIKQGGPFKDCVESKDPNRPFCCIPKTNPVPVPDPVPDPVPAPNPNPGITFTNCTDEPGFVKCVSVNDTCPKDSLPVSGKFSDCASPKKCCTDPRKICSDIPPTGLGGQCVDQMKGCPINTRSTVFGKCPTSSQLCCIPN